MFTGLRTALAPQLAAGFRLLRHDPQELYVSAVAKLHQLREHRIDYVVDPDWRQRLGVTGADRMKTEALWAVILRTLESKGIRPGPESYLFWNDGDPALIEAIWCLIRRLDATRIVETGVAHGVTARFILEALGRRRSRLWSIDYPPPWAPERHHEIGAAVEPRLHDRWTLVLGSSRRRLPALLKSVAPIDLFIHDSDHREYNMRFEMAAAWAALRPGGAMVVDDVDCNAAFHEFSRSVAATTTVCEAQPLRPDHRRKNDKGLFGVMLKP